MLKASKTIKSVIILSSITVSIATYGLAIAEENNVCSTALETCKSSTIIHVKTKDEISRFCDLNKSVVVAGGGWVCVRK